MCHVEAGFSPARIEGIAGGHGLGKVYDQSFLLPHQRNMDMEGCYSWGRTMRDTCTCTMYTCTIIDD